MEKAADNTLFPRHKENFLKSQMMSEMKVQNFVYLCYLIFGDSLLGARTEKSGLKSDSEAWDDSLFAPGFYFGCKADSYMLSTFPLV